MEYALIRLARAIATVAEAVEIHPSPNTARKRPVSDTLFLLGSLAGFVQVRGNVHPEHRFDTDAIERFASDESLRRRILSVTEDVLRQNDPPSLLECLQRHVETFDELKETCARIMGSEGGSASSTPPRPGKQESAGTEPGSSASAFLLDKVKLIGLAFGILAAVMIYVLLLRYVVPEKVRIPVLLITLGITAIANYRHCKRKGLSPWTGMPVRPIGERKDE